MINQKRLLLRVFCYYNLKNDGFKVTYLEDTAIVEDANGDCILLFAKENNIVECYDEYFIKPFRTMQFINYEWKDL